jgi:hypothetical protein
MENHPPQNADWIAASFDVRNGETRAESNSAASEKLWRQQRPSDLSDLKPFPAEVQKVSGANDRSTAFWEVVFNFFLDGFASYAASLYRSSVCSFEVETSANRIQAGEPAIGPQHDTARSLEQTNVRAELKQVPAFDASRRMFGIPSQLSGRIDGDSGRSKAVLTELDDQTLRDIRSDPKSSTL